MSEIMIVLTTEEKDWLVNFLETEGFTQKMLRDGLAIIPIEFRNGWMLPLEVLDDPRCAQAKQRLIEIGELGNMTVRDVLPEELFSWGEPEIVGRRRADVTASAEEKAKGKLQKAEGETLEVKTAARIPWYKRILNAIKRAWQYCFS
jgi:hypothetical protein